MASSCVRVVLLDHQQREVLIFRNERVGLGAADLNHQIRADARPTLNLAVVAIPAGRRNLHVFVAVIVPDSELVARRFASEVATMSVAPTDIPVTLIVAGETLVSLDTVAIAVLVELQRRPARVPPPMVFRRKCAR